MKPEHRTTKAVAVTPEVWRHLEQRRKNGEAADDVLRRVLGLEIRSAAPPRDR